MLFRSDDDVDDDVDDNDSSRYTANSEAEDECCATADDKKTGIEKSQHCLII